MSSASNVYATTESSEVTTLSSQSRHNPFAPLDSRRRSSASVNALVAGDSASASAVSMNSGMTRKTAFAPMDRRRRQGSHGGQGGPLVAFTGFDASGKPHKMNQPFPSIIDDPGEEAELAAFNARGAQLQAHGNVSGLKSENFKPTIGDLVDVSDTESQIPQWASVAAEAQLEYPKFNPNAYSSVAAGRASISEHENEHYGSSRGLFHSDYDESVAPEPKKEKTNNFAKKVPTSPKPPLSIVT